MFYMLIYHIQIYDCDVCIDASGIEILAGSDNDVSPIRCQAIWKCKRLSLVKMPSTLVVCMFTTVLARELSSISSLAPCGTRIFLVIQINIRILFLIKIVASFDHPILSIAGGSNNWYWTPLSPLSLNWQQKALSSPVLKVYPTQHWPMTYKFLRVSQQLKPFKVTVSRSNPISAS